MDTSQWIINVVGGCLLSLLGWIARTLWSAVQELKNDLAKLREEIPKNYVPKDDLRDFKDEVLGYLRRIEDKIDKKADK